MSELEVSDAQVRRLLERLPAVLWTVSAQGMVTYVSDSCGRVWGRRADELLGPVDGILGTLPPDDRGTLQNLIAEVLEAGGERTLEHGVLAPDGAERRVRTCTQAVRNGTGEVVQVAAVSTDVSDEWKARQRLREISRRLRRTLASLADAVLIVDSSTHRIVDCNEAAVRMFRFPRGELIGRSSRVLHVNDSRFRAFGERSRHALERGRPYRTEFTMRRKDGSTFESAHTVMLLDPETGLDGGVVSVIRDVSEERGLERQLAQAQRLEAVGRLAGGIAHDFNNLLSVIRPNAELLEDHRDPWVREAISEIRDAADQAARLTSQLLAVGRRQVLEPTAVDLNDAVEGMERLLRRALGPEIELRLELAPRVPPVELDPSRLEQVVMNLVLNARAATSDGGEIVISSGGRKLGIDEARRISGVAPGSHAFLSVRDTGIGMDEETRSRIFEPFFTTRGEEGGTGLGLSTVYGIVSQSGGGIEVRSTPGQGSEFVLWFPVRRRRRPRPVSPVAPSRGGTILVVEEDPGVRQVLERILRHLGYGVVAAASAVEAIEIAAEMDDRLDLCLTDLVLPGQNGLDLVERLREAHPEVRPVIMSGYSEEGPGASGAEVAGVPYLSKPFTIRSVSRTLREALDVGDAAPPGAPPAAEPGAGPPPPEMPPPNGVTPPEGPPAG